MARLDPKGWRRRHFPRASLTKQPNSPPSPSPRVRRHAQRPRHHFAHADSGGAGARVHRILETGRRPLVSLSQRRPVPVPVWVPGGATVPRRMCAQDPSPFLPRWAIVRGKLTPSVAGGEHAHPETPTLWGRRVRAGQTTSPQMTGVSGGEATSPRALSPSPAGPGRSQKGPRMRSTASGHSHIAGLGLPASSGRRRAGERGAALSPLGRVDSSLFGCQSGSTNRPRAVCSALGAVSISPGRRTPPGLTWIKCPSGCPRVRYLSAQVRFPERMPYPGHPGCNPR